VIVERAHGRKANGTAIALGLPNLDSHHKWLEAFIGRIQASRLYRQSESSVIKMVRQPVDNLYER
jgi:hypothetical protein